MAPPDRSGLFSCLVSSARRRQQIDETGHGDFATGLWLPLITPFRNGAIDTGSLSRLVRHYAGQPIDGLVLAATTGEGLSLDDKETGQLVSTVASELEGRLPIVLGLGGVDTRKLMATLQRTRSWPIAAYLIACPYYVQAIR